MGSGSFADRSFLRRRRMDHGYGYGYGTYGSGNFWSRACQFEVYSLGQGSSSIHQWTFPSRSRSRSLPPVRLRPFEPRSSHVLHPFSSQTNFFQDESSSVDG